MSRLLMQLRDGRRLSYLVLLAPLDMAVATVVYHHGWPSSAAEAGAWQAAAAQQGVQVVAVDRPGVAGSRFDPPGSFASYTDDVGQLIAHLGLSKVVHLGASGGGPYACACAALQPTTTAALGLVASMTHCAGPGSSTLMQGMDVFNRIGFSCIAHAPQLTALSLVVAAPAVHWATTSLQCTVAACSTPKGAATSSSSSSSSSGGGGSTGLVKWAAQQFGRAALYVAAATLPGPDRRTLVEQPGQLLALLPSLLSDAFTQGSRGLFADMRLTSLPWDFSLSAIAAPTVVFQGDADVNVTVHMARWLGQQIPGAEVRLLHNEAHFSLVLNHAADILEVLL